MKDFDFLKELQNMTNSIKEINKISKDGFEVVSYTDTFCDEMFFNVDIRKDGKNVFHATTANAVSDKRDLEKFLNAYLNDLKN